MIQLQGAGSRTLWFSTTVLTTSGAPVRPGSPGALFGEEGIRSRFENLDSGFSAGDALARLFMETSFWQLTNLIGKDGTDAAEHRGFQGDPSLCDSLAYSIVELYGRNLEMAFALGERYGFSVISAWQPSIWYGRKGLSPTKGDTGSRMALRKRISSSPFTKPPMSTSGYCWPTSADKILRRCPRG